MMRIQRRISMSVAFMIVALAGIASVFAQQPPPDAEPKIEQDVIIVGGPGLPPGPEGAHIPLPPPSADVLISGQAGGPIEGNTFTFVSSEMSFDGHVVKGAPYSAEAVTEMTQTLGDGNRIVRKSTASVYRDGEGRTRRDQTLGSIGPFAAAGDPPQTFFINDPVAGFNFILDPRTRTARKLPLPRIENLSRGARPGVKIEDRVIRAPVPGGMGASVMIYENVEGEPGPFHAARPGPKPKTEALGKQMIEGVEAEGTRTTITIPAGQIGNERPIQIVNERWYSPELQTVVMTKNTDPLVGESVYRLTNINRNEPPRSLFEVPADYKLREVPPPPGIRIMRRPANDK
ncbi:MAG TPA: hypothetical protein VE842_06860 [Pyrinomonadaceae bacterium]|nr:hypothetical protein [Pyrinomonadaceae bacterium]